MNLINISRQLDHPNLVRLHEVYEGQDHIYLVNDLIEGENLLNYLAINGSLTESESRDLII